MDKTTKIKNFCRLRDLPKISKKAQGISVNIIIIAAIALIVLVVLVAIFTGRMGMFGQKIAEINKPCAKYILKSTITTADGGTKEETYSDGSWKTECGNDEKQAIAVSDANQHPNQVCCLKKK